MSKAKKSVMELRMGNGSVYRVEGDTKEMLRGRNDPKADAMIADMNREMGLPEDGDWGDQ